LQFWHVGTQEPRSPRRDRWTDPSPGGRHRFGDPEGSEGQL